MKIYLAGPMRGLPDWNFPAFDAAEARWQAAGHTVFSPASVAVALGYGLRPRLFYADEPPDTPRAQPTTAEGRAHLQHVMLSDVASLFAADAIALLPGWERSRGAAVELALAQFLGLPVYDAETMREIHPPKTPWVYCPHPCAACNGTGYHRYEDFADGTPNYSGSAACSTCHGTGQPT